MRATQPKRLPKISKHCNESFPDTKTMHARKNPQYNMHIFLFGVGLGGGGVEVITFMST